MVLAAQSGKRDDPCGGGMATGPHKMCGKREILAQIKAKSNSRLSVPLFSSFNRKGCVDLQRVKTPQNSLLNV